MNNKENKVKLNNNPLPYFIGSLLLIFSIIAAYYISNGNSLDATENNVYFSQSSTSAEN
jgi:hypothetical protein